MATELVKERPLVVVVPDGLLNVVERLRAAKGLFELWVAFVVGVDVSCLGGEDG